MKLARFGIPGNEKPALIDAQGRLCDLSGHLERPENNLRALSFTAKRKGGNCYEHANANE
jgi:hypothetical protein